MADVHDKETRSFNMSRIHSKNTKPEIQVRKALYAKGYRFRLHDKNLPGKPDIVLKKFKTVVFVHGCFWHAHSNCKFSELPKTRTEWWSNKIQINKFNDAQTIEALELEGWKVIVVWGCELKPNSYTTTINYLISNLNIK